MTLETAVDFQQRQRQAQESAPRASGRKKFACLFTKHKTQKRKVWQDGRLVVASRGSALLFDACPSLTGTESALDQCELRIEQVANAISDGIVIETEKYLITIEGPWQDANPVAAPTGSQSAASSLAMKKILSKKFRKPPAVVAPMHPCATTTRLHNRKRPIQPGELLSQHQQLLTKHQSRHHIGSSQSVSESDVIGCEARNHQQRRNPQSNHPFENRQDVLLRMQDSDTVGLQHLEYSIDNSNHTLHQESVANNAALDNVEDSSYVIQNKSHVQAEGEFRENFGSQTQGETLRKHESLQSRGPLEKKQRNVPFSNLQGFDPSSFYGEEFEEDEEEEEDESACSQANKHFEDRGSTYSRHHPQQLANCIPGVSSGAQTSVAELLKLFGAEASPSQQTEETSAQEQDFELPPTNDSSDESEEDDT